LKLQFVAFTDFQMRLRMCRLSTVRRYKARLHVMAVLSMDRPFACRILCVKMHRKMTYYKHGSHSIKVEYTCQCYTCQC